MLADYEFPGPTALACQSWEVLRGCHDSLREAGISIAEIVPGDRSPPSIGDDPKSAPPIDLGDIR
jgi:hypothetical protein